MSPPEAPPPSPALLARLEGLRPVRTRRPALEAALLARGARRWRGRCAGRAGATAPLRQWPRAACVGGARWGDRGAGAVVGDARAAMSAASPAELMSRYCDGDRAAFDALYVAVAPKLL